MTYPYPIRLARLDPIVAGDIDDFSIDLAAEMATGETVASTAFTVTDSAGATVAGTITGATYSAAKTSFRFTAPATAGVYTITAVATVSDGRKLTHTVDIEVV